MARRSAFCGGRDNLPYCVKYIITQISRQHPFYILWFRVQRQFGFLPHKLHALWKTYLNVRRISMMLMTGSSLPFSD
jgi:hypothetical protein